MELKRAGLVLALMGAAAAVAAPGDVSACGGCFTGPTTVQVVTDHRMVLAVSGEQTTLWDQFQYSGDPADFSWILPIRYTERTRVALADDGFMRMADSLTAPVVVPPTRPFCFNSRSPMAAPGGAADASASDAGVMVLRQEVIGPYAVAIIRGENPMAIRDWLSSNGYAVPTAVVPIIDHYTAMRMDYVALRLRPGEGVNRMTPVRVTFEGSMPVLPLRMIAAGVADRVGLSLVVVAPSRYEAQNFPNGEIREADLTYDFSRPTNPASDFLNAFASLNRANGNRLWLTETATRQARADWEAQAPGFRNQPGPGRPGGPFGVDAGPVAPVDAGSDAGDAAAPTDPVEDVRVAFQGLGDGAVVTRLRANLPAAMLTEDLRLQASDLGLRARQYNYGRLLNDPGMTCNGTTPVPASDAGATPATPDDGPTASTTEGGIRCAATPGRAGGVGGALAALVALAAAGLGLRARRRK